MLTFSVITTCKLCTLMTQLFLNDQKSVRQLMKTLKLFSKISGLKHNILKCEVVGIGYLKGVKMAISGIKFIDLTTETLIILGRVYSSSLLHAIIAHNPFFKIFSDFVIFAQIFKYSALFCLFSEKLHACPYFLEKALLGVHFSYIRGHP